MTDIPTNPEDLAYLASIADPQKLALVAASLAKHRQDDTLEPGDRMPSLPLVRLLGGETVNLADLAAGRPLVLIFGSYT